MNTTKEVLVDWLCDAYAMEKAAVEILEKQAERVESYPRVQKKIKEHLEVTRSQADRVEQCIKDLDGSTSALKTGVGKFMGNMQALANSMSMDEVVKDGIGDYMFEQFEIASYRSLVEAAEAVGEQGIKQVCQDILREEEEMAAWLEQELPGLTREFLQRRETEGGKAKR